MPLLAVLLAVMLHFEHQDECIDPRMESMGWRALEGRIEAIEPDGQLRVVNVFESGRHLPPRIVRMASVDLDLPAARPFLKSLIGKKVSVWINGHSIDESHILGIVYRGTEDINRTLLSRGLGRYAAPPAYSVSEYSDCLHRIAEREARAGHRGLWTIAGRK